jgi:hypothetical protein
MSEGPSDWERGDVWEGVPEGHGVGPTEYHTDDPPHTVQREAWDIASTLVSEYLEEGEPAHRADGTSEAYLIEAKRALRLHELDPGHTTWTEVIGFQSMVVRGTVDPTELRGELTRLGLYVMQWLHDLNQQEEPGGEVQAG